MAVLTDKSTRALKRAYIRNLKKQWKLVEFRMDGFSRDIGYSADYWEARDAKEMAQKELIRRGVEL